MVDNMALEAIMLAGLTYLLVAGVLDISCDGVAALAGVAAGLVFDRGYGTPWGIAAGLGVGVVWGLMNGLAVQKLRLNPLLVTLASWWLAVGTTYGVTRALSPYGFPAGFTQLGATRILGLRIFVFYAVAVLLVWHYVLTHTVTGRHLYAMGGNRKAADLCGVRTDRLGVGLYLQSSLLAACIGLIMAARINAAAPQAIDGMTLRVLAGAVVGGCALSGGRGTIAGGLMGLVLMAVLSNAIIVLHVSPYWQRALIGGVLFIAIAIDQFSRNHINGG